MVRFADDAIFCFQYRREAEMFYVSFHKRLAKFGLEMAEEKTKLIEFGRFAEENRKKANGGKPDTFDFLGFTHYCDKSRNGKFMVKRKTSKKKFKASLAKTKAWLRKNLTTPIKTVMRKLNVKLRGYYQYYCMWENWYMVSNYLDGVKKLLFKMMNRRSQKRSVNWSQYIRFLKRYPLIKPKVYVNMSEFKPNISYLV